MIHASELFGVDERPVFSGDTAEQDGICAQAGLDAAKNDLK